MNPPVLYLSPHPDDAVFSCGGALAADCASGAAVTLVTAFTRPAEAERRLREDRAAAALLGCRHANLDLPAAAARPEVRGALDAFAPLGQRHLGVISEVVARLRRLAPPAGAQLYAPLGVGGHIDHRLIYVAARALAADLDLRLCFYEDQPYSQLPGAVARRLVLMGARTPEGALPPGDPAEAQAALRRFLNSTPRDARPALATRLCRRLTGYAPALARAQWHHDQARSQPGAPPVLQPRLRPLAGQRARKLAAVAAYASQWPRYADSPEALIGDGEYERLWDEERATTRPGP